MPEWVKSDDINVKIVAYMQSRGGTQTFPRPQYLYKREGGLTSTYEGNQCMRGE